MLINVIYLYSDNNNIKTNTMENILKVTGFTEVEFTKLYTDAMNKLMSVGYNEDDARTIVINGVKKSLGL